MSDISVQKRLDLIKSIREENNRNRLSLNSRDSMTEATSKSFSSFPFRFLFASILFSLFVILDSMDFSFFSINAVTISTVINENYALNTIDFIKEISYTLKDIY